MIKVQEASSYLHDAGKIYMRGEMNLKNNTTTEANFVTIIQKFKDKMAY